MATPTAPSTRLDLHLNSPHGYTCQVWLATEIADRFLSGQYRTWFATKLDALENGNSSNPLAIYRELTHITAINDFNNGRIEQLRARLTNWVAGVAPTLLSPSDRRAMFREIAAAPVKAFRPEIWRIELSQIDASRLINLGQFPDEHQVQDLIRSEFEVIVPS